jgi:hypothetical protein
MQNKNSKKMLKKWGFNVKNIKKNLYENNNIKLFVIIKLILDVLKIIV